MNFISLFDGISCGKVAAERAGIQVDNYFASELPVGYTSCLKNKEMRGKCIGNGWTVDVIAHIFKGLKNKKDDE